MQLRHVDKQVVFIYHRGNMVPDLCGFLWNRSAQTGLFMTGHLIFPA